MDKVVNKAYKDYSYVSRYSAFPYYYHVADNKYIYGITAYLSDTTPYTLYTVQQGDNLDNLALKYYNNPTYYWIICSFNHITNPYKELVPGQKLKIPSISTIQYNFEGRR